MDEFFTMVLIAITFSCGLLIGALCVQYKIPAQTVATAITTCDTNSGLRYILANDDGISARCQNGVTFQVDNR